MALNLQGIENDLWQALSQDKRPLAVLIGAGCPVSVADAEGEALIPAVSGLTAAVVEDVSDSPDGDALQILLTMLESDLGRGPDIEEMLTRLRTLRQVVGQDTVRGLSESTIDGLERAVTKRVITRVSVDLPDPPTPYDWLARWAGGTRRTSALEIFTTNYDLLVEQALERTQVPFFDGFVGGHRPFLDVETIDADDVPARWVRLWKLHGSVHWSKQDSRVRRVQPSGDATAPVIHPSHLKYEQSRRMPYLVMQDRLRSFFQKPSATLVTCGYSFSDEHVNELIAQGLQGNASAVVFALLFSERTAYPMAFALAMNHPNLIVLARDEGCVGAQIGGWSEGEEAAVHCDLGDFGVLGRRLASLAGTGSGSGESDSEDDNDG